MSLRCSLAIVKACCSALRHLSRAWPMPAACTEIPQGRVFPKLTSPLTTDGDLRSPVRFTLFENKGSDVAFTTTFTYPLVFPLCPAAQFWTSPGSAIASAPDCTAA